MSFALTLQEAAEHGPGIGPYIVAASAAAVFILSGVIVHSFRDVAHRRIDPAERTGGEHH